MWKALHDGEFAYGNFIPFRKHLILWVMTFYFLLQKLNHYGISNDWFMSSFEVNPGTKLFCAISSPSCVINDFFIWKYSNVSLSTNLDFCVFAKYADFKNVMRL